MQTSLFDDDPAFGWQSSDPGCTAAGERDARDARGGHISPQQPLGILTPVPRRNPTAFTLDGRPLLAFDWSRSVLHVVDGSREPDPDEPGAARYVVRTVPGLQALIAELGDVPHKLVCESTLESWDPCARYRLVTVLRAAGHELYVFRPIQTARQRKALGIKGKTNEIDARLIYRIADEQLTHVYPLPDPSHWWGELRDEANSSYQLARLADRKTDLAAAARAALPRFADLDPLTRLIVTDSGRRDYSPTLLAAAYHATQHATCRAQFERLLGLHGSAYPALLRAEIHKHHYPHAQKRWDTAVADGTMPAPADGQDFWTLYRRTLRSLFAQLKAARSVADVHPVAFRPDRSGAHLLDQPRA